MWFSCDVKELLKFFLSYHRFSAATTIVSSVILLQRLAILYSPHVSVVVSINTNIGTKLCTSDAERKVFKVISVPTFSYRVSFIKSVKEK